MATSPDISQQLLNFKTWRLRVPIHCQGCEKEVKTILQNVDGVYKTSINSDKQRVTVTGNIDSDTLIKRLLKSGRHASLWPERKTHNNMQDKKQLKSKKNDQKKHQELPKATTSQAGNQKKQVREPKANKQTGDQKKQEPKATNQSGGGGDKKKQHSTNKNPEKDPAEDTSNAGGKVRQKPPKGEKSPETKTSDNDCQAGDKSDDNGGGKNKKKNNKGKNGNGGGGGSPSIAGADNGGGKDATMSQAPPASMGQNMLPMGHYSPHFVSIEVTLDSARIVRRFHTLMKASDGLALVLLLSLCVLFFACRLAESYKDKNIN